MKLRVVWGLALTFLVLHYVAESSVGTWLGIGGFWVTLALAIILSAQRASADRAAFESRAQHGVGEILQLRPNSTDGLVDVVVRIKQVFADEHAYREPAGETFTTEGSVAVNAIYYPRIQPGCTVPLIYDPQNRARFELGDLSGAS